ncbi:MAG: hypothetical protein ABI597_10785, partial [Gammaproteobacteria bacterium]
MLQELNLSPNSTTYYATWVKKAKLSQLKQIPDKLRLYLHLIAFIQHQFYLRQDSSIDIFLKSVQSTRNQAKNSPTVGLCGATDKSGRFLIYTMK